MEKRFHIILAVFVLLSFRVGMAAICTDDVCTFELVVRARRSMTYTSSNGVTYNVAMNATEGCLQIIENSYLRQEEHDVIGDFVDDDDVITADGYTRNIIVINEQFPGPTLEVIEGAQVVIRLVNELKTEAVTLHVHGLRYQDNVWMDGTAHVTQCPVLPRHSFEYRFTADPVGTHWYHSMNRNGRLDGFCGIFLVHPRIPSIPYFPLTIHDWNHYDATTLRIMHPYDPEYSGTGESALFYKERDYLVDGNEASAMRYFSTLISGRGRSTYNGSDILPLTSYNVTSGSRYRFHIAHVGWEYAYEFSIDNHAITLVASDGFDLEPIDIDSLIINPGETFDIEVDMDTSIDQYWIRAEVLREGVGQYPQQDGIVRDGRAILRYINAPNDPEPTTERRNCTSENPCVVFNCPYRGYPNNRFKVCLTFEEARSNYSNEYLNDNYGIFDDDFDEYFINFGFHIGSNSNGRKFAYPFSPLIGPNITENITPCDEDECDSNGCYCTQIIELLENRTIQLVLSNLHDNYDFHAHHVIYIHGHSFAVLKVGFPSFNETSGLAMEANEDVICDTEHLCAHASWNSDPPLFNLENPPLKNSIIIPARGYVSVRFNNGEVNINECYRANNPGYWLLRCHHETHLEEGMAMLFNEAPENHPPVPDGFPTCGDFYFTN